MLMVMPRCRSSGALSIWSNADAWFRVGYLSARTFVIAAVRVVLPWSTWPMVPMLTCGLLRSNFAFATAGPPQDLMMRRATHVLNLTDELVRALVDGSGPGTLFEPGPVTAERAPHHLDCGGYGWPRFGANPHRSVSFSCCVPRQQEITRRWLS